MPPEGSFPRAVKYRCCGLFTFFTDASCEIKEYWVVDLKNRLVKVFRDPIDGNYIEEITLTDGEITPIAFE